MAPKFSVALMNERIRKDERYYHVYKHYRPNLTRPMLPRKFYSKYEVLADSDVADPMFMEKIHMAKYITCRGRYPWPATCNQEYGWFSELLVPLDRDDRRLYAPRQVADFVKHAALLQKDLAFLPKVQFTGIPFKLM